jgi:hypothetical protein
MLSHLCQSSMLSMGPRIREDDVGLGFTYLRIAISEAS